MTTKNNNFTNKELLIRIDERQKNLLNEVVNIKDSLNNKVNNDEEYSQIKTKVNSLWDFKNRFLGYSAGAGAGAAIVFEVIKSFF